MESPEYKKLLDDTKVYFNARYDLLKLELLEKLSRIIGLVILALVVVLLVFGAFAFFGMALIFLLSKVLPLTASCCILGAIFLLVMTLAILFKESWFINPVVQQLSKILFAESDESGVVEPEKTEEVKKDEQL
jgi:hypothetical protein